ncbi:hypothetical protein E2C01_072556 [Portunus trituberculatus]|uniref:Uncharacterized protein n=1 Tax=Portunus trituberculatus TaxID=210409 RepID=A0A5B7I070_PORTR|nr:hypothetical protein [Portunus trituberculatus]
MLANHSAALWTSGEMQTAFTVTITITITTIRSHIVTRRAGRADSALTQYSLVSLGSLLNTEPYLLMYFLTKSRVLCLTLSLHSSASMLCSCFSSFTMTK